MLASDFGASWIEEVVSFLIVVFLILWKVWPPLRAAMDKKAASITAQLAKGDEIKKSSKELLERREAELAKAKRQAEESLTLAKQQAEHILQEGQQRSALEKERILARVDVEIAEQRARMKESVILELADLVLQAARYVVDDEMDDNLQHRLIDEVTAGMEGRS